METLFPQFVDELLGKLLRVPDFVSLRLASAGGDKGSETVVNLKDSLVLELAVDLDDGVGIYYQGFREAAYARQLIARYERARLNGMTNLLFELDVNGDAG